MYYYFKNLDIEDETVSLGTIKLSITFAVIHGVLEVLTIWIEAKVFKQPFFEYFVICFNGRLGWVPLLNKFQDRKFIQSSVEDNAILNYDRISEKICGEEVTIDYLFSNQTALSLAQELFKLSREADKKKRPKVTLG